MSLNRPLRITALLFVAGALLAAAPARAETKIAVVDMNRAIAGTDEGKAAQARVMSEAETKKKLFNDRKAELQKLGQDYEKQKALMNEDARKAKEADLQKRIQDLQEMGMVAQKEFDEHQNEAFRPIFERMGALLRELAEADGISVVLAAQTVPYASDSLDLTNELIRKYNARYKGGAGAPAKDAKKAKGSGK